MARHENTALPAMLAAAQEQLHRRRCQRRQERLSQHLPVHTDDHGRLTLPWPTQSTNEQPRTTASGDKMAAEATGTAQRKRQDDTLDTSLQTPDWLPLQLQGSEKTARSHEQASLSEKQDFTLHPDLAIVMLRQDLVAPGRIWYLLRHVDEKGVGWVHISRARALLTEEESPLYICGWRQLRNLMAQGDGIFWHRHDGASQEDRLWLRSPEKVAMTLGLRRFSRRPVTASLDILLEGIGTARAHFFASLHSGRDASSPIARKTLEDLTGVSRRSQQAYEARAGVETQHHWAVAETYSKEEAQHRAWKQGNALFILHDRQGRSGAAGQSYLAWQMPNSYVGPHTPQAPARKKRINRRLADLFNKGKTGNGEEKIEKMPSHDGHPRRRYFEHGRAAAQAYNRHASDDLYWRAARPYGQYEVWHLLPAQKRTA